MKGSFSDLAAKIRKRGTWPEVFGWSDRPDPNGNALFRAGPLQVAEALSLPELKIAGLNRLVRIFSSSLGSIHYALASDTEDERGRWYAGRYSRSDLNSARGPAAEYEQAVLTFIKNLRKASPAADFEILRARLLYSFKVSKKKGVVFGRRLKISADYDREKILGVTGDLLEWSRKHRREGRPPDDSNILIYHVVNQLTYWKRGPDGAPLLDRRRRYKLDRHWNEAAEMLIWLHYHQFPMPWLAAFIRKNAKGDADRAMLILKKVIQRRYSHLAHRAPIGRRGVPEGAFYPLGIRRVVAETNKFRAWEL